MTPWNWVNIGAGNSLLPDGTKLLPEHNEFENDTFKITSHISQGPMSSLATLNSQKRRFIYGIPIFVIL